LKKIMKNKAKKQYRILCMVCDRYHLQGQCADGDQELDITIQFITTTDEEKSEETVCALCGEPFPQHSENCKVWLGDIEALEVLKVLILAKEI